MEKRKFSILFLIMFFLVIRKTNAEFSYQPSFTLADIPSPYYIGIGDLNNDGRPDLIVSSWYRLPVSGEKYDESKSRVYIFYNKEGIYKHPADKEISTTNPGTNLSTNPGHPVVGDFDNDGKNDLAVPSGKYLHLFFGKEDFSVDHSNYDTNQFSRELSIGKISKTGIIDFLVGPVWRKLSKGDSFQNGYFFGPTENNNNTPTLCDLNMDGATDIVFTGLGKNILHIYYGPLINMTVRPSDTSEFIQLTTPFSATGKPCIADLNGDGRPDIVISSVKGVLIYYQNAPIGFTDNSGPSVIIEGGFCHIATSDLNNDGLDDLVMGESAYPVAKIYIFYQKKGKPFAKNIQEADQVLDIKDIWIYRLQVADINGDGLPDIITTTPRGSNPGVIRCFLNNADKARAKDEGGDSSVKK